MKKNKFYITTSIAYANAPPHIGFALELVQADVLARYHRKLEEKVFFSTGTDEHGVKIMKTAEKLGESPKEFVDKQTEKFRLLSSNLNLSNDDFIRTTDEKRHIPAVRKVWLKLKEKGDIYKKKYQGFYCVGCESFLTEKDLVDGKCPFHQRKPEKVEEENYFFRLSKYSSQLKRIIEEEKIKIIPRTRRNEMISFIEQGLEDVSFSRSKKHLKWGIDVPDDNEQVIYVWADALTNYLSVVDYLKEGKKFKEFWPADVHIIGVDIQRFHCIFWPAMLLSLGLPLPRAIFIHGFITIGGEKMSKSLGNVVDPLFLIKKYGADALRYYLLREIPSTKDGDFTYEKFERRYNDDLAKGLGNLTARILSLYQKIGANKPLKPREAEEIVRETQTNYEKAISEFRLNDALASVWRLISWCDKYIDKKKPWETKDSKTLSHLLFLLEKISQYLFPFLPATSRKISEQLKKGEWETLFPKLD